MPLEILAPMVVFGIAGIALLIHLMGFSRPYTFADEDDARARWLREYEDDSITAVTLTHDRHAALIDADKGPGIVWAMGADTATKRLTAPRLEPRPDGLRLRFHDFTTPAIRLHLDPAETAQWQDKLKGIAA